MSINNFTFIDSDKDSRGRLTRGPSGLVTIENIDCRNTICSADVVLVAPLERGQVYKYVQIDKRLSSKSKSQCIYQIQTFRLGIVLSDTAGETTVVDAEIIATHHKSAFKRLTDRLYSSH